MDPRVLTVDSGDASLVRVTPDNFVAGDSIVVACRYLGIMEDSRAVIIRKLVHRRTNFGGEAVLRHGIMNKLGVASPAVDVYGILGLSGTFTEPSKTVISQVEKAINLLMVPSDDRKANDSTEQRTKPTGRRGRPPRSGVTTPASIRQLGQWMTLKFAVPLRTYFERLPLRLLRTHWLLARRPPKRVAPPLTAEAACTGAHVAPAAQTAAAPPIDAICPSTPAAVAAPAPAAPVDASAKPAGHRNGVADLTLPAPRAADSD